MYSLQDVAKLINKNGKFWIAFTGDSIASTEWVHPNWREIVEYVLQSEMTKYLGDWKKSEWAIRGFNFALDGATTRDILERVENIKLVNPDLVISLMGGNDPTLGISVEESVENIRNLANKLKTSVVWCSTLRAGEGDKKNNKYEPYSKAFLEIEDAENFQKIDMFNIYSKFPLEKFYTFVSEENPIEGINEGDPDLQHPNQLGNAYIAKVILNEVFGITFDPEKYWKETLEGEKYPSY